MDTFRGEEFREKIWNSQYLSQVLRIRIFVRWTKIGDWRENFQIGGPVHAKASFKA